MHSKIDIFPDTYAGVSACTADAWMSGTNIPPPAMSLNPDTFGHITTRSDQTQKGNAKSKATRMNRVRRDTTEMPPPTPSPKETPEALQKELTAAHARIQVLERRLKKAGLSVL